jgi:L-2-hydroxyglutarate oxidase LhgO
VGVERFDVVIIGAGIIGLSVARALKSHQPSLKVLVCEKEASAGLHASSRNSGVLHAGFYYSPESLKAKFCRDGNRQLREFIQRKNLPLLQIGKVVVTQSEEEEERLVKLYDRGVANGVKLEFLPAKDLSRFEPLAITHQNFLWSPTTAVSDPRSVLMALAEDLVASGVEIRCSSHISNFSNRKIYLNSAEIKYKHLINAAGSQADRIAHGFDVGAEYSMLPFMGMYRYVEQRNLPIQTLVYPVPHVLNPFLGVHFTMTFDKLVKIGPTAIPILGREQYKFQSKVELLDMKSTLSSSLALARGSHHSIVEIAKSEFPKFSSRFLVSESSKLVPTASRVRGWKIKPPGIRAQLVNLQTGELVQDFLVKKGQSSTHVLNAVSPGWTSALPFGEFISNQVLDDL